MSISETMVRGTLKSDGSLELDEKPNLAPGRVQVFLKMLPEGKPLQDNWWDYLQQARRQLEKMGHAFRSKEEIDAEMEDLRSGDERLETIR